MVKTYKVEKGIEFGPRIKMDPLLETFAKMKENESVVISWRERRKLDSYLFRLRRLKNDWSYRIHSRMLEDNDMLYRCWVLKSGPTRKDKNQTLKSIKHGKKS